MTKQEEAISGLKEIRDWAGLPYCIEEPLGKEGVAVITTEMIDTAIKALEQEPILNKIRAEINKEYEKLDGYDPHSLGTFACRIDDIFDEYKAGSEK